jgi:hypothetical protein
MNMRSKISRLFVVVLTMLGVVLMATGASASTLPTGETILGQSVIEPAYNDVNGSLTFLLTPFHPPVTPNEPVAPLYVIMYPTSAASSVGTVNCQHQPADNCPDHGPLLAGLAATVEPAVYGSGVWGHDHILAVPPSPPPGGGDFNIIWEPVVVLFTSSAAANTHITTLAQLNTARANHDVTEIPLPQADFYCSVVSAAAYNHGTPVPAVP